MKKVLVICGATASGKTRLAVDCALKFNGEVISADSQLVYKGLNVGTAKPTAEEMRGVQHHMIDVIEATESFNVGDYAEMALPIVENVLSQGKLPIICGGTGFYINALLFELSYGNASADENIRRKYTEILQIQGKEALYNKLKIVDPESAKVLHVNDTKRVIRALEIYDLTGKKKSAQNDGLISRYDYTAIAIDYPRDELYERINRRVDEMFASGLVDEVKGLLDSGISENYQCMQAIGYKEVVLCLKNGDLQSTMSDIIKQNTRHYAKRQLTFFKKLPNICWLKPEEASADRIKEIINGVH